MANPLKGSWMMRVIVVQPDMAWEDKSANFDQVRSLLAGAEVPAGSLIVLPEMFATGFSMNVAGIAEPAEGGETQRYVESLASQYRSTVLAGLVVRAADGRGLNQALAIGPDGREVGRYSKMHPFTFAGEDQHYAAGDEVVVLPVGQFQVGLHVCYDLRFPELYRQSVRRGADVLVTMANFPLARQSHWLSLNVARAIENQAYVVGCNRCGRDPGNDYGGRSLVVDPQGAVLADGGDQAGIVSADLETAVVSEYRSKFPALADMRERLMGGGDH